MTRRGVRPDDSRRAARRRRRRRRLGLPFRQGAHRARRPFSPRRAALRICRRDRRKVEDRRRRFGAHRVVDRDPPRARARRRGEPRRAVSGAAMPCRGRSIAGQRLGPHARRADRQHRARADQPSGARGLRRVAPGRRATPSGGGEFRRPPDRRQRAAAARSSSPGFRRRSLRPRDDGRVRRAHPGRAKVRFARRCWSRRWSATLRARARFSRALLLTPIWRFCGKSSNSLAARSAQTRFLARNPHDRRARQRLRLFADAVSAEDRFSDARGPAAEGAGDSRALGARRPLRRSCARAAKAGRSSCCTTGRPTPTAISTSATRSTRS